MQVCWTLEAHPMYWLLPFDLLFVGGLLDTVVAGLQQKRVRWPEDAGWVWLLVAIF